MNINKKLLPLKAQFFLFNAGLAGVVSFLPVYARQLGFSSVVVGTIYTVLPITGMLAKPIFGAVADRFQLQKTFFLACQVMVTLSYFVVQFVPEIPARNIATLTCDTLTYFKTCDSDLDSCAMSQFLADVSNNNTVFCQATCYMAHNALLWKEVCTTWQVPQYCNALPSALQFTAEVPMKHNEQEGSCLYFRIHSVQLAGSAYVPYCVNLTTVSCDVQCDSPAVNQLLRLPIAADTHVAQFYQFWLFFMLMVVAFVSTAVATTMRDTICFQLLGGAPQEFGKERLWGAVGWGVSAILTGVLVDEFSMGRADKDCTVMFCLMLVLMALSVAVSAKLECSQQMQSSSIMKNVRMLISETRIIIFLLWCIFVGMTTGLLWQFLFWHLEDLVSVENCEVQQWIKTLEGLAIGVRCFGGELPFFFLAGRILKKIGHVHAMSLVLFTFGLRCVLYGALRDPWWCLPLELLQGITFGISYTTMVSYASLVAPPGNEATMQGVVGAVFEGVGLSLGSLLGGILYDTYGGAATFQIFGVASFTMFILHVLVQYYLSRNPRYSASAAAYYMSPDGAINVLVDDEHITHLERSSS